MQLRGGAHRHRRPRTFWRDPSAALAKRTPHCTSGLPPSHSIVVTLSSAMGLAAFSMQEFPQFCPARLNPTPSYSCVSLCTFACARARSGSAHLPRWHSGCCTASAGVIIVTGHAVQGEAMYGMLTSLLHDADESDLLFLSPTAEVSSAVSPGQHMAKNKMRHCPRPVPVRL